MKNDTKFEAKMTGCFKIDTRNSTNFDLCTRKSKTSALEWAPLEQIT